jgi:hypothetical protein
MISVHLISRRYYHPKAQDLAKKLGEINARALIFFGSVNCKLFILTTPWQTRKSAQRLGHHCVMPQLAI